jgi:large subunit ribosomal protein L17
MRHQRKTIKLGRSQAHRDALLANQVCSLIEHSRIKTTLAKAKAVRPLAEKMVTLGKKKTLHARRTALATLRHNQGAVKRLFDEVAPRAATRNGGYTRIIKLGLRMSDAAPMAFIEWVDNAPVEVQEAAPPKSRTKAKPTREPKAPTTEKKENAAASKAAASDEKARAAEEPAPAKPAKKPRATTKKSADKDGDK